MISQQAKFESYKRDINLVDFMQKYGWVVNEKKSAGKSFSLTNGSGVHLIVTRSTHDHHWVFFSTQDRDKCGTIIDFLISFCGQTMKQAIKILDDYMRQERTIPYVDKPNRKIVVSHCSAWNQMKEIDNGKQYYLNSLRGIKPSIINHPKFRDVIRVDGRGNACFVHHNEAGICGYEIKNTQFTGFSSGGSKGLWSSKEHRDDQILVICEATIDALSYACLFGVTIEGLSLSLVL